MKAALIAFLIILGFALGLLVYQYLSQRQGQAANPIGVVSLSNRPDSYCPTAAEAKVEPANLSQNLNVTDCRTIDLRSLATSLASGSKIYLKLPFALTVELNVGASLQSSYQISLELGDVNNDNVIDQTDEQLIRESLFIAAADSRQSERDVDGDKTVTMLDLALAKLNHGVGAVQPNQGTTND